MTALILARLAADAACILVAFAIIVVGRKY